MAMAYSHMRRKMLSQLFHSVDAVIQPRNSPISMVARLISKLRRSSHRSVWVWYMMIIVARILRKQQRVDLDVRQDALAVLPQRFSHQLSDPQAQYAPLGRRKRELVATLQVVVERNAARLMAGLSMASSEQASSAARA